MVALSCHVGSKRSPVKDKYVQRIRLFSTTKQCPKKYSITIFFMAALVEDSHHGAAFSSPPINFCATSFVQCPFAGELPEPDLLVRTSGGVRIPVHSTILASASTVLENSVHRTLKHWSFEKVVSISGVPCEAVVVFIGFLYSSRCAEEQMKKFGIHLLALSHVYLIPQLKQVCTKELGRRLTVDTVVDVLQLARLCDAPSLYLKCMKLVYIDFKVVEETEGWKFLQYHDPWLELEILRFIDETEQRKKKTRRQRKEGSLYMELSEAMECLEHIFKEGCTSLWPHDIEIGPTKTERCTKFGTCRGLQLLIRHFATCKNRVNGCCSRCKRMWQLLRLHSSICDQPDSCKVPLCRKLKTKTRQVRKKKEERRWKMLARKVASAKVMSSLSSLTMRKIAEDSITVHGWSCSSRHHKD